MDSAWKTFKKIILILLFAYFVAFLLETDFLIDLVQTKPKFDFSRYLYKILNLE